MNDWSQPPMVTNSFEGKTCLCKHLITNSLRLAQIIHFVIVLVLLIVIGNVQRSSTSRSTITITNRKSPNATPSIRVSFALFAGNSPNFFVTFHRASLSYSAVWTCFPLHG
jgi:hypothetical protein